MELRVEDSGQALLTLDGCPTPPANSLRSKGVPCKTQETPPEILIRMGRQGSFYKVEQEKRSRGPNPIELFLSLGLHE
jgi:hypothetical protein